MTRMRVGFAIAAVFSLFSSFVYAQKITLNTTGINSNSGLSQNTIQCILKDRYGFMWFGTQDGLNKYDGYKFTIYKNSPSDPSSIAANLINSLCEDADGNLWVGTRLGGLCRYDRLHDSFVTYKNNIRDPNSLSNNSVQVIYNDKESNLWIGTEDGLNRFDSRSGKFKRYTQNAASPAGLSNSNISAILEDDNHDLWIGTLRGLNCLDTRTGNSNKFFDRKININGDNNLVNSIVEDDHKNIWIGTGEGLNLISRKDNNYAYYPIEPDKNLIGNINSIYCLAKTRGNKFWIGSNTTIQLFDADKKKLIPIDEKTNGEDMMPNDGISALFEDNAGILWIGTTSEGVVKYDRNLSIFPSYRASLNNNPSAINIIRSISEDSKSNLYLGTDNGIEYFNRANGTYTSYKHNLKSKNCLSNNYILTVLVSKKNGLVWIGTFTSGLDCYNPVTGIFKHFSSGTAPGQIAGGGIYALLEDKKGNIWFSPSDGGVYEYQPSINKFTHFMHNNNDVNSICDNTIQALYEDSHGNIWMGGYSYGISILNPSTKTFSQLNVQNSKLTSNVISAFYEDRKGTMWVGTMDGGLNFYQPNAHRFKSYTENTGVVNNTINYIAGDKKGNIWLSTIHGIVQLDPATGHLKNYGYHNGLKSLEFNFGTGDVLSDGKIAFGSINGFTIVDPDNLHFNRNKPVVSITGFEVFDKPLIPNSKDSPLTQDIASTPKIRLNRSQSMFSIDFAALDYTIPENNKYAYKLDGFDNEWRHAGSERKATYTNLDPGDYTFRVKAANESGIWGHKETTIKITIVPPYWMTWWFRSLCVAVFAGACYLFFLYKSGVERKQKIALEEQVEIRTLKIGKQATELQEKTGSLESLLEELTQQKNHEQKARLMAETARLEADKANLAKSTFLATMSHEIRTPLNGVLGMAALLAETDQTREQRDYTNAIVKSGDSLLLVINDILDFSKIESGNLKLEPHAFDLRRCVEDVLELFSYKATEMGLRLYYHIDDLVPAYVIADGLRLRQVLTNLVGNAIKFTPQGEVAVRIKAADPDKDNFDLAFEIIDTGIGIKKDQIGKLFRAFDQGDSSITRKYGGTGLGLVICQRLIKLMGGEISVSSKFAEGSNFKFHIHCLKAETTVLKEDTNRGAVKTAEGKKSLLSAGFALTYPMSILVAEDNLMNQKLILRVLSKLGYPADIANDGTEVLTMMRRQNYDLVLMDIQMPNMDGLEATRTIRKTYGLYPVIAAMTANALSEDKENCLKAGMDNYMSKPLSIEALIDELIDIHGKISAVKREDVVN